MGSNAPKAKLSPSSRIVKDLYGGGSGPLATSLYSILAPSGDEDVYAKLARQRLTDSIRSGYAARGLGGSGISAQGEIEGLTNFDLGRMEQQKGQALSILGAGTGGPTYAPQSGGSGFLGLK